MALEIERKFRVRGDGWKRHIVRARRLRQAYLTKNDRISMRVRIDGGLNWEIDVFDGDNNGLVIAEIELDRADRAIELPHWIGEEVTDDRRFYNADLAKYPFSAWDAK
jgi:CYTH domain-containing protein